MTIRGLHAWALALSASLVPMAASAQVIPGSCWGNCGERDLLSGCSCDSYCQTRGDCCPDKNLLCYGQFAYPLCPLVDVHTSRAVWGTDLGFSYEHKGKNEILFGDTWSTDSHPQCATPTSTQWTNDDSMATLDVARPASLPTSNPTGPVTCPVPVFRTTDADSFKPLTVSIGGTSLPMPEYVTPVAAWSDGSTAFMWVPSLKGLPCFNGFCGGSTVCDRQSQFCVDPTSPLPDKFVRSAEIAYRPSESNPTAYVSGYTFYTNKFRAPTMATVSSFDPTVPSKNNYKRGNGTLLTFGRPNFYDASGGSLMYLAYQQLSSLAPVNGVINWAPQYFNGLDASGNPTWTPNVAEADPIISSEFNFTGFSDVAWIEPLRKWVMLYGGDVESYADATQPRKGAIHVRMADHPWGPWTPPVPLLIREFAAAYMACDAPNTTYGTGSWTLDNDPWYQGLWPSSCQTTYQSCGLTNPSNPLPPGGFYAPDIIESWTYNASDALYPRAAQIYFNVSTGSPYQVILATARLELPPEGPVTFKRSIHLRAFDGELVAADGATATTSRKPSLSITHLQVLYKANPLASANVSDGNHVLIRADNGRYMRRRGNLLAFETAIVADSEWIIERQAGPGAVQLDTDVIRLLSATDDRHIKLKSDGLHAYDGGGETADFRLTWGCKLESDDCQW